MALHKKTNFQLTYADYAQIYNCHINTVSRWQKKNLPLDEPEMLVAALLAQRTFPDCILEKGIEAILSDYHFLRSG